MLETFVPMRVWLERSIEPPNAVSEPELEPEAQPEPIVERSDIDDATEEATRFRASLADALESCVGELLTDIAGDVLARELLLAPCDLHSIVRRAIARYDAEPVRVRVSPEDAPLLKTTDLAIIADDSLRSGDAIIETRHGSIDVSLGVRLERLLARLPA
jgi:flagellar biosynthesis/type III secretory pathway protein FliH